MYDYEIDDPTFVEDLKASMPSVEVAAKWLQSRGHYVTIKPMSIRPTINQMSEFRDNGDLEVILKNTSTPIRVEVKRRCELDFTEIQHFPWDSIIVDLANIFDEANPRPLAYIIMNKQMTAAFIVMSNTCTHWRKIDKFDRNKKRMRLFYECPLSHTHFVKF